MHIYIIPKSERNWKLFAIMSCTQSSQKSTMGCAVQNIDSNTIGPASRMFTFKVFGPLFLFIF